MTARNLVKEIFLSPTTIYPKSPLIISFSISFFKLYLKASDAFWIPLATTESKYLARKYKPENKNQNKIKILQELATLIYFVIIGLNARHIFCHLFVKWKKSLRASLLAPHKVFLLKKKRFSRYLFLRKAPSQMFDWVFNTHLVIP